MTDIVALATTITIIDPKPEVAFDLTGRWPTLLVRDARKDARIAVILTGTRAQRQAFATALIKVAADIADAIVPGDDDDPADHDPLCCCDACIDAAVAAYGA